MALININHAQDEDEVKMIMEANSAFENMKQWKRHEDSRSMYETSMQRALKLVFPRIDTVSIRNDTVTLDTEKHYYRKNRYDSTNNPSTPSFKCDITVEEMPDNAEDYLAMRKEIQADKKEVIEAMAYLMKQYSIEKDL